MNPPETGSSPSLSSLSLPSVTSAAVVLIAISVFAGCVGGDDDGALSSQDDDRATADIPDPWDEGTITIVDVSTDAHARADVLCTFGGGFQLDRTGDRVLPGADHLRIDVEADRTFTGFQIGTVLDANGADHAEDVNRSIDWFDPVRGEVGTHRLDLAANQTEDSDGPLRWHLYGRMNLEHAEQDCYTGGGFGSWSVEAYAVRDEQGITDP